MIKNQILAKRIAQLIAQTYALPVEPILNDINTYGIEAVIQKIEETEQNSPYFN